MTPSAGPNQTQQYVWYASYGSNMSRRRFDCYLKGTRLEGQRYGCPGARNPAEPAAVDTMDVPHRFFFARESPRWGGSMAFLEPHATQGASARLRLYKITLEQFNDVIAQENGLEVPLPRRVCVTLGRLDEVTRTGGVRLMDGPYGYLKYLGHRGQCPILTFTCAPHCMAQVKSGSFPWHFNMPSPAYTQVIEEGLLEGGMNKQTAQHYMLASLMGSQPEPPRTSSLPSPQTRQPMPRTLS